MDAKAELKQTIDIQGQFATFTDFNAGIYNGLVMAYNSTYGENLPLCLYDEKTKKWEIEK